MAEAVRPKNKKKGRSKIKEKLVTFILQTWFKLLMRTSMNSIL